MKTSLREQWLTVPVWIRRPVIFIAGMVFIIAAALTGWLPGPGGIPLFLVGIAILSTEFLWAKKVQRLVLGIVRTCTNWYRAHRQQGMIMLTLLIGLGAVSLYLMFRLVFFHI